jgi:hypothetical protein
MQRKYEKKNRRITAAAQTSTNFRSSMKVKPGEISRPGFLF